MRLVSVRSWDRIPVRAVRFVPSRANCPTTLPRLCCLSHRKRRKFRLSLTSTRTVKRPAMYNLPADIFNTRRLRYLICLRQTSYSFKVYKWSWCYYTFHSHVSNTTFLVGKNREMGSRDSSQDCDVFFGWQWWCRGRILHDVPWHKCQKQQLGSPFDVREVQTKNRGQVKARNCVTS